MISLGYLPLHVVGRSSATVTYREGHEVVEEGTDRQAKTGDSGHDQQQRDAIVRLRQT